MPRSRKYRTNAERQAAYRQRQKAKADAQRPAPTSAGERLTARVLAADEALRARDSQ